jgi:hypothetical protein
VRNGEYKIHLYFAVFASAQEVSKNFEDFPQHVLPGSYFFTAKDKIFIDK